MVRVRNLNRAIRKLSHNIPRACVGLLASRPYPEICTGSKIVARISEKPSQGDPVLLVGEQLQYSKTLLCGIVIKRSLLIVRFAWHISAAQGVMNRISNRASLGQHQDFFGFVSLVIYEVGDEVS